MEIMDTVYACMEEAVKKAREDNGELKVMAVGITNQRETTVVWDCTSGKPLHNAIVWQDTRTSDICQDLIHQYKSKDPFRNETGLPISTYFSGVKLKWLMDNIPEIQQAVSEGTCCFGTIDSWIIYNLTDGAVHITDVTNASRTMFMNLEKAEWDVHILEQLGVNPIILPKIHSNAEVYGYIKKELLQGIPIAASLGDQHAALLGTPHEYHCLFKAVQGHRCSRGDAKNTYGTGCFLLLNTGDQLVQSHHGLITGIGYKLGPDAKTQYMLEGSVAIAGSLFSWLKDNLGLIDTIEDVEQLAQTVNDSGGVFFVPAFSGLFAPHWRSDARGIIVGITGYTTKAHIIRAAMDAICFQTREVLEAMKLDAKIEKLASLKVDGGASQNDTLMQIQADVCQTTVARSQNLEATCLGAALAAGLAVGFYSESEVLESSSAATEFVPRTSIDDADKLMSKWKAAIERSLNLAVLTDAA